MDQMFFLEAGPAIATLLFAGFVVFFFVVDEEQEFHSPVCASRRILVSCVVSRVLDCDANALTGTLMRWACFQQFDSAFPAV